MDQLLLRAVAAEAAARLVEREVLRVSRPGRDRYLVRFATPRQEALFIAVRPDRPRLHLVPARGRAEEPPPDAFTALLDREIGGAVLVSLEILPWDRVVTLRFRLPRRDDGARERRLVAELVGRSANLLLLRADGTILGYGRDLKSEFRAPSLGALYRPPPGRDAYADIPPGPESLPLIRGRFGDPASFLAPLSPLLARDVHAAAGPADADRLLAAILDAARRGAWSPVVYSTRPLADWKEGDPIGGDDILISALPVRSAAALPSTGSGRHLAIPFASPSSAAEAGFGTLERLRDFQAIKEHHQALARREVERLQGLERKLVQELERAQRSEGLRRQGEALLAGLSSARLDGETAHVVDPYAPDGPRLAVPIDPGLSLKENAQTLFERYKKGKRGAVMIATRLEAVRRRLLEWGGLARNACEVRGQDDLDRLREAMARLGLIHAERTKKGAPAPRAADAPARVRRLTTREGFVVLVGKSGEENDALTFRVASPWDFWLHAADRPGAHVVVRNPQRLKTLPEPTLRVAAEIAAFYSGARQEGKVDVHYTQRKHVHKRRGMPSGQVLLRRFRTVQVIPRLPASTLEDV